MENRTRAAGPQNHSPHPEDWNHLRFRSVFWLAFILLQRLPMLSTVA